jgi:hypothetical protein
MVSVVYILYGIGALAIWSLLYRENIFYRCAEYFYVGFYGAHLLVLGWESALSIAWTPVTRGEYLWGGIFILALGFILFFYSKTRAFYMIPISLIVALGTALGMRGAIHAQLLGQIGGSMSSLIKATVMDSFNTTLITVGSFCTLSYFIFTRQIKGPIYVIPRIGRIFIMVTVGAAYANTGTGRLANYSGILLNLWQTDAVYIIPVALAFILFDIIWRKTKKNI